MTDLCDGNCPWYTIVGITSLLCCAGGITSISLASTILKGAVSAGVGISGMVEILAGSTCIAGAIKDYNKDKKKEKKAGKKTKKTTASGNYHTDE